MARDDHHHRNVLVISLADHCYRIAVIFPHAKQLNNGRKVFYSNSKASTSKRAPDLFEERLPCGDEGCSCNLMLYPKRAIVS